MIEAALHADIEALRAHMRKEEAERPPPRFLPGEAVRLDTGAVGVVGWEDDEGSVYVYYYDGMGEIKGPAFGFSLERIEI